MQTIHLMRATLVLCMLVAGCAGPKVLTDNDKNQLRQARTIKIDETLDMRSTPSDDDQSWRTIKATLSEKIQLAGLVVVGDSQPADATLKVYVTFVRIQSPGAPPPAPGSNVPSYLLIDLRLEHKDVGRVFNYSTTAAAPYGVSYPQTELIRGFDRVLLRSLYKPQQ